MAAAEARAAWQRTANRCFVQEDAKRAPKLACCPSSSAILQSDSVNGNDTSYPDHSAPSFVPLNWNPMNPNLSPDTKWWLQLQPTFGYQKEFVCEQKTDLENELEEMRTSFPSSENIGETLVNDPKDAELKKADYSLNSPRLVSTAHMKHDSERKIGETKAFNGSSQQPLKRKADIGEYIFPDEEFMDWRPVKHFISNKIEKGSDLETPWSGESKSEPWWHISDKDELVSLVAKRSLQHIENCDLPRPKQTVPVGTDPFACFENLESEQIFSLSLGRKSHAGFQNPVELTRHQSDPRSMDENYLSSNETGCLRNSEKPYSGLHAYNASTRDARERKQSFDEESSRAQLLEALRHSQTRAREAEIAAKKAYEEKEHILKLLFRQASHLFAYKQWLHILQLESLCLQLKIKDSQISTILPVLPWMPLKGQSSSQDRRKKQKKYSICRYAVVFAVGLGLAGAGLFLGWSLGWLLPSF